MESEEVSGSPGGWFLRGALGRRLQRLFAVWARFTSRYPGSQSGGQSQAQPSCADPASCFYYFPNILEFPKLLFKPGGDWPAHLPKNIFHSKVREAAGKMRIVAVAG